MKLTKINSQINNYETQLNNKLNSYYKDDEVQAITKIATLILLNPNKSFFKNIQYNPENPIFNFFACTESTQLEITFFCSYLNKSLDDQVSNIQSEKITNNLLKIYAELELLKEKGSAKFKEEHPNYQDYPPRRIKLALESHEQHILTTPNRINLFAYASLLSLSTYILRQEMAFDTTNRSDQTHSIFTLRQLATLKALPYLLASQHHLATAVELAYLDGGQRVVKLKENHITLLKDSYGKRGKIKPVRHSTFNSFSLKTAETIWTYEQTNNLKLTIPSHMAQLLAHIYAQENPTASTDITCKKAFHSKEETTLILLDGLIEKLKLPIIRKRGRPKGTFLLAELEKRYKLATN